MNTLQLFSHKPISIPTATAWSLADLGEARGKQTLFTKQAPQRLKALREHALIESAVSSNRIEGVVVDLKRVGTVVFGKTLLRDRDEEEVRGYRKALDLIHKRGTDLPVTEETIRKLHALSRPGSGDAGEYKQKDSDIIERLPDGRERVRFRTVEAKKTSAAMKGLVSAWEDCLAERWVHPLVALAAFNLDFLCIHPFRDGNGRASRLLLLLQSYHLGYEVGRYISLERLIEQNKERYYETLERSSQGWHEGKHDPWPYVNHVLFILKEACRELEETVGDAATLKGAKTDLVLDAIGKCEGSFRVADLQRECPGVGIDLIRKVLKKLKAAKQVACLGRGAGATWKRVGSGTIG